MLVGPIAALKSRFMNKGNEKTQSLHHQHVVSMLQGAGGYKALCSYQIPNRQ